MPESCSFCGQPTTENDLIKETASGGRYQQQMLICRLCIKEWHERLFPPLSNEHLDEIAARADAATPGPWGLSTNRDEHMFYTLDKHDRYVSIVGSAMNPEDTRFIIAARTDVPALVAEVRRLRAAFEGLIRGKVLGDPWSITSCLAKERDQLQEEVRRLNAELEAVKDDLGELHGRALLYLVDCAHAQEAAENYHAAWQDAATYWKDKVAALEKQVADLSAHVCAYGPVFTTSCPYCGHWGPLEGCCACLKDKVAKLRQALADYSDHDPGCPKRYIEPDRGPTLKTHGVCDCGLDEELGIAPAKDGQ